MTGWLEILTVAFIAQLTVLPGEKGQFIIAGLSTRYDPWIVVAAAGTAFAGWTVLEIILGAALQQVLAPTLLDIFTAALFLLFAVLLYRTAPESTDERSVTDGGTPGDGDLDISIRGRDIPPYLNGFVPIFLLMAAGEVGDKTQLITIGLAVQYGAHPAIWAGEMLAILPVSILNALVFHRFADRYNARYAHLAGAALFLFFGLDTVLRILTGVSIWETAVDAIAGFVLSLP